MTRRPWLLIVALLATAGCGGKKTDLGGWLFPPSTGANLKRVAESPLPDERREAIEAVARDSSAIRTEPVVKVFCLVAENDQDALVRAAAVRGLARMDGENVLETLGRAATKDASQVVRHDAVQALGRRARPERADVLMAVLKGDPSADVRIEAAEALRRFKEKPAAESLVAGVEDRDVAVARKVWESLRYMTGQDLPRETKAWTEYLASAENPFERYGKPPAMPKGASQRSQFTKGIGDFFGGLFEKDPLEAELE